MAAKRILIVDDDRSVLQLYRTALAFSGFIVDTADDGLGALQSIEVAPPNLVVLDLDLPCVHGRAVLEEIVANAATSQIPVVVVTGTDCPRPVPQAAATLRKPCDPEALVSTVERHLGRSQLT